MQTLGVLFLLAGVWVLYAGITGIPPLESLQAILKNPGNASKVISDARASVKPVLSSVGSSTADGPVNANSSNPLAKFQISCGFACHKKRGSVSPGVDYAVPVGTPVVTPVAGLVSYASNSGYGNYATVTTKDGYRFHFGHLSKFGNKAGQEVSAGTVIGSSGNTGSTTGPNIHIDILTPQGTYIDPVSYLARSRSSQGGTF